MKEWSIKRIIPAIFFLCISLFMIIHSSTAIAEEKFRVGDKIHLIGTYTASSDGTGKKYSGLYREYIIARIQPNTPNPYALQPLDKNWIDGWANENSILHDYTDDIFRSYIKELQTDSAFMYFGDDARNIESLYSYYKLFNHGAKYDIKREECWNKLFSIPYPGWGVEFWFNGYIMTPEILGNYLYGLTGCYWGFPGIVIHQGAGYAQKGSTAYLNRPDLYYGDNADDYYWIEQAIVDSNSTPRINIDLSGFSKNYYIWDAAIGILK